MKTNYEDSVKHIQVTFVAQTQCDVASGPSSCVPPPTPPPRQVQAEFVERHMHEEFEKLHGFLRAEEDARMEALKMEEEQKSREMRQKIEEMTSLISSVSESIRALEEETALEGFSVLRVRRR